MINSDSISLNKILPIFTKNKLSIIIILLSILVFLVFCSMTAPMHRWGDASTYYLQIQSIAEDLDIQYQQKDIVRALQDKFDDIPAGLFLIKTASGTYYYGKEFSYALFASPFYKVIGNNGILLFNALMLFAMIFIGYLFLRKSNNDLVSLAVSILFFIGSAAFVYIFWIHAEIYNMFLIALGLFLWHLYHEKLDIKYLILASLIVGLSIVAKAPNGIFFIPLILLELYNKRYKNFAIIAISIALPILLFYGYFYFNTGAISFYGGNRLSYVQNFPFLNGFDDIREAGNSASSINTNLIAIINITNLKIIPYNIFYYFFGRFTGILWYYPFAVFALITSIAGLIHFRDYVKLHIEKICVLAGILLYIALFTSFLGDNYLGGGHAVGNRYFYIYPAFLFLLDKIDLKKFAVFIVLAIVTVLPIIACPISNSITPAQHTNDFPYNYLPIEYSQLYNLPLWYQVSGENGITLYSFENNPYSSLNGIILTNNTPLLVRASSPVDNIEAVLISYSDNNSIQAETNGHVTGCNLNDGDYTLINIGNMSPVYYDSKYYIYELSISQSGTSYIQPINKSKIFDSHLIYLDNWYAQERWDNLTGRWMSNDGRVLVYSNGSTNATLSFTSANFYKNKTLNIYLNGEQIHQVAVDGFTPVEIPVKLVPGNNIIRFYTPEGYIRPADEPGLNINDPRNLSIAILNMTVDRSF